MLPFGESTSSAACASCHREIAEEWRASLHRRSFSDPWFAASYRAEPRAFCRDCHAPTSDAVPDRQAEDEGVSCAVCHLRGDAVVSSKVGRGPHDSLVDARWATGAVCAGCHQFPFNAHADSEGGAKVRALMQATVDEWGRSDAAHAGTDCGGCHMPLRIDAEGRAYRSHAFEGTSKAMLARAVEVTAVGRRVDATRVEVVLTLRAKGVGHAFPTGDPFRSIEVLLSSPRSSALATLARTFRFVPGRDDEGHEGLVRRDDRDLRVLPDAPRVVTLRLLAKPGDRLRYTLSHLRTTKELAAAQGVPIGRTTFLEGDVVMELEKTP